MESKEVRWEKKKKRKRKGKERNRTEGRERRKKKGEKKKKEFFPAFRRSKLDVPRRKVDPCNTGYAWVQNLGVSSNSVRYGIFLL